MKKCVVISGSKSGLASQLITELPDTYFILIDIANMSARASERAFRISCDITDGPALEKKIRSCIYNHQLTVCGIVNAAAMPDYHAFSMTSYEDMSRIVSTKAVGYANVIRACFPYLTRDASIVNVSSVAAYSTRTDSGVMYAAANAAIIGMTKALSVAEDFRRLARVNAVCPGGFLTDEYRTHNPEWRERLGSGQVLRVEEVTSVIRYLLSPESSGINGAEIKVETGVGNVRANSSAW